MNSFIPRRKPGDLVSDKNSPDHGFGIMNMRRAVKKYGGEYNMNCDESGDIYTVEVEIMLPLREERI